MASKPSFKDTILTHLDSKSDKDFIAFAKTFIEASDTSEISARPAQAVAKIIRTHWEMLKESKGSTDGCLAIKVQSQKDAQGKSTGTIIDIISHDMSFIVDSVTAELTSRDYSITSLIHPLTSAFSSGDDEDSDEAEAQSYSHLHITVSNALPLSEQKKLAQTLTNIMDDVKLANKDWPMMKAMLRESQKSLSNAPSDEHHDLDIEENLEFLEYLYQDNFTLLGYREFSFSEKKGLLSSKPVEGSSLGLLRNERKPIFVNKKEISLPTDFQIKRKDLPALHISKVNRESSVHRKVPLDCISVKLFDKKGKLKGEGIFIGLFTSVTYNRSLSSIPYLRRKAEKVLQRSGFKPGTHDYRSLRHILEKYPRDEFFQIKINKLTSFCEKIMKLHERRQVALFVREDLFSRYVSCLVYVPRDRFETALRLKFKTILENAFNGEAISYHLSIDDSPLARVMYTINIDPFKAVKFDQDKLEKQLQDVAHSWPQKLFDAALSKTGDDARAFYIRESFGNSFSSEYQEIYPATDALYDIEKIETVLQTGRLQLNLFKPETAPPGEINLKAYNPDKPILLSSVFPVLENMGLSVNSELPSKVALSDGKVVWVHDFSMRLENSENNSLTVDEVKPIFEEALFRILKGEVEDDRFNQLVIKAGIPSEHIVILRGYLRYLRQTSFPFSKSYTENTLARFPEICRLLVDLFFARFDPSISDDARADRQGAIKKAIDKQLEKVSSLDHDQIIRLFINVISHTLRTNYFQKSAQGKQKAYLSFKLESAEIKSLPKPKPFREIFVYSRRTEGIHLRGDEIARGGIRWSDRHEDFRTEVLGLMKAQQTKNSIIVPMGAKGGFIVKHPPASGDRQDMYREGVECYRIFIRGLLDLTDNLKGHKIEHPENVVRHDGDDPYLVVAADKGTASFSDIANALSEDYDFWLRDAFASGGSAGYDHKEMGITARGAWESVKRHFRELNYDIQKQEFSVVGVGDMGGDVFGNGMLLSEHIRLIGAFNHLHIFCDPDPNTEKSFKERKRLFEEVKGWDSYDEKLLSKGGRIYNRSEKSLTLTPEIKERFQIVEDKVSPNELMTAMLKAQTDLLWFGGIGTYIKSFEESHGDVGDKSNDAMRINGNEVRAKVIGEGANLAITQRGRIEYAKHGGRINADFIDNSGGVDSSDHEVNIKILLNKIMDRRPAPLTMKSRNALLDKMEDEVASLVLEHNYQQAQALSLMELSAASKLGEFANFMHYLESETLLDRKVEFLPDDEEIAERKEKGRGLTRPELAVVSCYAKINLTKAIMKTKLPDQKATQDWLTSYFPQPLQKKYGKAILQHRLKRAIFSTILASTVVNRMGPTFVDQLCREDNYSLETVLNSFLVVYDIFDLGDIWDKIEAQDGKMPAMAQLKALEETKAMTERIMMWFLGSLSRTISPEKDIEFFSKGVKKLKATLKDVLPETRQSQINQITEMNEANGFPRELAHELALLGPMSAACDIVLISSKLKVTVEQAARAYYLAGEYYSFYWLRKQAKFMETTTPWELQALERLRDQLYRCQSELAKKLLKKAGPKAGELSEENIRQHYSAEEISLSQHALETINELKSEGTVTLPMLVVAVTTLKNLYD